MVLRKLAFALRMCLSIVLLTAVMHSQTTASVKGTVTDQTGAAVVGATVVVKSPQLGIERTTHTGGNGSYEVPALPPATYSVEVQMAGFQTEVANNLVLEVSQNSVQNFGLKV